MRTKLEDLVAARLVGPPELAWELALGQGPVLEGVWQVSEGLTVAQPGFG